MERQVKINKLYRHFKGGIYRVISIAKDSETEKEVVVYRNNTTNETWVRPLDMFLDKVDKEKYPDVTQEYRFEQIYPIRTNPNSEIVTEVRDKIRENGGYCPCNIIQNEDTKCMCKEFRESNELGYCHCGLYYRTEE